MPPNTILAAVGRFPQDDSVLVRALAFASLHRAALIVAHVVPVPDPGSGLQPEDALHRQLAEDARTEIEAALLRAGADPALVEVRVEFGAPALRLIDLCKERRPGLIVMRAHQRRRIVERFAGSTVDRVIAAALAPVLVLRQPAGQGHEQVLVATDGRDFGAQALSYTAALLPEAELRLVRVVDVAAPLEEAMMRIGTGSAAVTSHLDALKSRAEEELRTLADEAAPHAATQVLEGDAAEVLLRATRAPKADLVVVGPGRGGPIRRFFLGSVTRQLLHAASCDVLVFCPVPPAA